MSAKCEAMLREKSEMEQKHENSQILSENLTNMISIKDETIKKLKKKIVQSYIKDTMVVAANATMQMGGGGAHG